jgi:hypothetical protein
MKSEVSDAVQLAAALQLADKQKPTGARPDRLELEQWRTLPEARAKEVMAWLAWDAELMTQLVQLEQAERWLAEVDETAQVEKPARFPVSSWVDRLRNWFDAPLVPSLAGWHGAAGGCIDCADADIHRFQKPGGCALPGGSIGSVSV